MLVLEKTPGLPEFNNSAGRLLALLKMLPESGNDYFNTIVTFYGGHSKATPDRKGRAYLGVYVTSGSHF